MTPQPPYQTAEEYAARHGRTARAARQFAEQGRIPGAVRLGPMWMFPVGAPWPELHKRGPKPKPAKSEL